jgi:hypothetical protein
LVIVIAGFAELVIVIADFAGLGIVRGDREAPASPGSGS